MLKIGTTSPQTERPPKNPKYCYRWAFEGAGRVLLCLWHSDLSFTESSVEYYGNARNEQRVNEERSNDQRDPSLKQRFKKWASSAYQMDEVVKIADREGRLIRVALVASKNLALQEDERAAADFRLLDPQPWNLVRYDMQTGSFLLRRGLEPTQSSGSEIEIRLQEPKLPIMSQVTADSYGVGVADQFVGNEEPERIAISSFAWVRSPQVRQVVLARSKGFCELCGRRGFLKGNGDLYLETHHVVSLSEEGGDAPGNVIALCPEHHREAHYGANRQVLRSLFQELLRPSPDLDDAVSQLFLRRRMVARNANVTSTNATCTTLVSEGVALQSHK
nr:hypothetical protein GCM10020185_87470 [Pseudomonas brassicacearum subsp. brassicacearum]